MIDFALALFSCLSSPQGLLLALALVPRLTGRAVIVLAVLDLWLLLEVLETLARPGYVFGSHAMPRLMTSAVQTGFALAAYRAWRGARPAKKAVRPIVLPRPAPGRRPLRPAYGPALTEAA